MVLETIDDYHRKFGKELRGSAVRMEEFSKENTQSAKECGQIGIFVSATVSLLMK